MHQRDGDPALEPQECWRLATANHLPPIPILRPGSPTQHTNPSSFLFLVVRPGATSRVLAPSNDALCY